MTHSASSQPEVLETLRATEHFTVLRVQKGVHELRMTQLSPTLSESHGFRAAFRKDQSVLSSLRHGSILQFVEWGEHDGQLYYLTELPEGRPLDEIVAEGAQLTVDEIIDVLWQVASGLQHAHNLAVAHGQLTLSSVFVAAPLRITVAGLGLYRWIAESRADAPEPWRLLAARDLIAFGLIVEQLLACLQQEQDRDAAGAALQYLKALADELRDPDPGTTARDVQGRLGDMLLAVAGESIDMVDHRKGLGLSRRSIVDELFETPVETENDLRYTDARGSVRRGCIAAAILAMAAALLLWLTR